MLNWIIGFLIDLPNFFGWGRHAYSKNILSCLWDRAASHGYTLFMPLVSIVLPSVLVFIFYLKIFIFVLDSKRKTTKNLNAQIHIAKGLFGSFALFASCW